MRFDVLVAVLLVAQIGLLPVSAVVTFCNGTAANFCGTGRALLSSASGSVCPNNTCTKPLCCEQAVLVCGQYVADTDFQYTIASGQTVNINTTCTSNYVGSSGAPVDFTFATGSSLIFKNVAITGSSSFTAFNRLVLGSGITLQAQLIGSWASGLYNIVELAKWKSDSVAPCSVPASASISNCPTGYSCSWYTTQPAENVDGYCHVFIKVVSNSYVGIPSPNFYTFKLDQDCVTYTEAKFVSTVVSGMANVSITSGGYIYYVNSANLETYPRSCGSVFQTFRCLSIDSSSADMICSAVKKQAEDPTSALNKALKWQHSWAEDTATSHNQPSSSNPALFGLIVLLVIPLVLIPLIAIMMMKKKPDEPMQDDKFKDTPAEITTHTQPTPAPTPNQSAMDMGGNMRC